MNGGAAGMTKRNGNIRTALMLATFALGLFVFTLYNGLK